MPSEMVVGKIEFAPVMLDTYSAGRQMEINFLRRVLTDIQDEVAHNLPTSETVTTTEALAHRIYLMTMRALPNDTA